MLNPITWFFRELFFRPLFNFLVVIYNFMPIYKDVGIAVIIFVILMRIVLLPLRQKTKTSHPIQKKIMKALEKAKEKYKYNAIAYRRTEKAIIKKYRGTFNLRIIDLFIEGVYFAILWRIFGHTLPERQWQYLYSFVAKPPEPMNLTFLNMIDLTQVNLTLNAITAVGLFIVLFFHNLFKAEKTSREDYIVMIWGPFAAYFITMFVPAGDEFFFGVTEAIELLLIFNDQMPKLYKKFGFKEAPIKVEDFVDTAKKQISGQE